MNVGLRVLRRNIASLIRRTSSMEVEHPIDSEQSLNTARENMDTVPPPPPPPPPARHEMSPGQEDTSPVAAGSGQGGPSRPTQVEKKKPRQFDFSMWNRRRIALKLAYLGWDYHGFAIQEHPQPTIESCLFECLQKTKLIADSRSCHYTRCGRTDKGVSALGQVVSLEVRSNLVEGEGVTVPEDSKAACRKGDKTSELPYMVMLNNGLPGDIKVVAWATVDSSFSARFSCLQRTYKYFFPLGEMNLDAMRDAAQRFVGEHDFRNFCKMDIGGGVTHFRRSICRFYIDTIDKGPPSPYSMCEMTVVGKAFLMHQVRCMAAILFLVGNGLEQPSVVDHMLDIDCCPRKPQYGMAAPEPLILYDCTFDGLEWERDQRTYEKVVAHFQSIWTTKMVQTAMVRRMLDNLEPEMHRSQPLQHQIAPLMQSDHKLGQKSYKPLLERPTSNSFEERYEHHKTKKRKLAVEEDETNEAKSLHLSNTMATS